MGEAGSCTHTPPQNEPLKSPPRLKLKLCFVFTNIFTIINNNAIANIIIISCFVIAL